MEKESVWATKFLWSAIIQGALLAIVTFILFVYGSAYLTPTPAMLIASGSAGTWLTLGYIVYLVMIVALGVTAFFYSYIQNRLGKKLDKLGSQLAMAHLWLMNIGVLGATLLMIYAGYVGGKALAPTSEGGLGLTELQTHVQFLSPLPLPIVIFLSIALIGAVAGGIAFIRALKSRK